MKQNEAKWWSVSFVTIKYFILLYKLLLQKIFVSIQKTDKDTKFDWYTNQKVKDSFLLPLIAFVLSILCVRPWPGINFVKDESWDPSLDSSIGSTSAWEGLGSNPGKGEDFF